MTGDLLAAILATASLALSFMWLGTWLARRAIARKLDHLADIAKAEHAFFLDEWPEAADYEIVRETLFLELRTRVLRWWWPR